MSGPREDYPLARFGYGDIEAEDPIECPKCGILFDTRFWGQGEIRWMNRNEDYAYEAVLVCPDCKSIYPMADLLKEGA